jgi:hypothetical protein
LGAGIQDNAILGGLHGGVGDRALGNSASCHKVRGRYVEKCRVLGGIRRDKSVCLRVLLSGQGRPWRVMGAGSTEESS